MVDRKDAQQGQLHRESACRNAVFAKPDYEYGIGAVNRAGNRIDVFGRVE